MTNTETDTAAAHAALSTGATTGERADGRELIHESIVGTEFRARVAGRVEAAGRPAVVPAVSGMAYRTGRHVFELDPADPLREGFVLR